MRTALAPRTREAPSRCSVIRARDQATRPKVREAPSTDREEESMKKETMVQALGVLVAVATVAVTIAALLYEFTAG